MTGQAVLPHWATPAVQQVADLHTLAAHSDTDLAHGVRDALDWVTNPLGPNPQEVQAEAAGLAPRRREGSYWAGIGDTLAWLVGWQPRPPMDLPRRNPDGTVPSVAQVVAEMRAGAPLAWEPEQAEQAEQTARRMVARWTALADRIDR